MNQRNTLNLGLALALAVLVIIVTYESGNNINEDTSLLTQLTPADIQKIVIQQINQPSVMLSKTDSQWQMNKPYKNSANTLRITKLLALVNAKSHAQYSTTDINLKQLRLITPGLIINLNDTKLSFGTTDALNGYRYIQINNTVHLITDRYSHLIRGQAANLLNPALLPNNTLITKLVLPEWTLQSDETGWKIIPDINLKSADTIQQFLDQWRFARAIRVSKFNINSNTKPDSKITATIELQYDHNQVILFNLIRTEDSIILKREDIGLSYYFTNEAGQQLLKLPLNNNPTNDK